TGLLRVRLDQAIDLLSLALWPCMFLLLWRVGEHVGGKRAGVLVAVAVCYSGGWPIVCSWKYLVTNTEGTSTPLCTVNGLQNNPPFISYFFQHPWSLAVPIFCLLVLQRGALPRIGSHALGLAALVCAALALSLANAVLFLTTVVALALTEA